MLIPPLTKYRVATVQYDPIPGAKEQNVHRLLELVEEAIQNGARLIVLPEMSTTGYCWTSRKEIAPLVEPIPGPTTERFQQLSRQHNCFIAIGMPEIDLVTQIYYNSVALLGPQGVVGSYRKIHSYISEPRWARDGDQGMPVWDTPLGRLSPLICMDAVYFEAARIPALRGADVLLFPTNWVNEKSPAASWMARAFENGVYMIAANRYGKERGVQFSGGSCIINPDGSLQAYRDTGEGIVYGEIDLMRSRDKRWMAHGEPPGHCLMDRRPSEYVTLVQNSYLWEPLRYHNLYSLAALPTGQLSCAGIVQMDIQTFATQSLPETLQTLRAMLLRLMRDNEPARPDVLVLPELLLPGPVPASSQNVTSEQIRTHYQQGAIQIPGPETQALIALADELQISMVVGIAEQAGDAFYNTVLLIDPEGIYGVYRKLHLSQRDRLWACPGNLGLPTFDIPTGRIALATGYDVLFPETLRVLAGKGVDLVCAPTLLDFPDPVGLPPSAIPHSMPAQSGLYDPIHYLIWRVRAAENNVFLAMANWQGSYAGIHANGLSGIFPPTDEINTFSEIVADENGMVMMTIDTREQRTGHRTTRTLSYSPGDMAGSLTGELAYDILDSIPGNVVRSKPLLRKRQPFWYLDLVKTSL